jgi:plasmid stabilization system protein ParE
MSLITGAVDVLTEHPLIGRGAEEGMRELVISHGRSGFLALYRFREAEDMITVLAIRRQREAGYTG